jgi:hypothetical protein
MLKSGRQIMNVGYGLPDGPPPPVAASIHLNKGSSYEMLDPFGWHSVEPQDVPSLSLMVTGVPWATSFPKPVQKAANRPLSDGAKTTLLLNFL